MDKNVHTKFKLFKRIDLYQYPAQSAQNPAQSAPIRPNPAQSGLIRPNPADPADPAFSRCQRKLGK